MMLSILAAAVAGACVGFVVSCVSLALLLVASELINRRPGDEPRPTIKKRVKQCPIRVYQKGTPMPINYDDYPPNWATQIRPDILTRDGHKCKFCGVNNYAVGYRDPDGNFHDSFEDGDIPDRPDGPAVAKRYMGLLRDSYNYYGAKHIMIVLTVAHLDHDRTNNDYENLAALCQRCHLHHDRDQHERTRKRTWEAAQAQTGQLSIFGGICDDLPTNV